MPTPFSVHGYLLCFFVKSILVVVIDLFKDWDRRNRMDTKTCMAWYNYENLWYYIYCHIWFYLSQFNISHRVKVGNIAHMVWFAHFLFTDSAYIAHAFQCITISFYRTNVNVMSIHGVTNRPKMTTPSIVWWEGRLLFLEVVTHFWVHDPLFLWSKQLLFQFKIYVVACW